MSTIVSISTAPRNWWNRHYPNEWERMFYNIKQNFQTKDK